MKFYKNLSFWLIISYLAFMFYRTPGISDGLILIALSSLYGFQLHLDFKREERPRRDEEFEEVRKQLDIEQAKLTLENLKEQQVRQAELRVARNKAEQNERQFTF